MQWITLTYGAVGQSPRCHFQDLFGRCRSRFGHFWPSKTMQRINWVWMTDSMAGLTANHSSAYQLPEEGLMFPTLDQVLKIASIYVDLGDMMWILIKQCLAAQHFNFFFVTFEPLGKTNWLACTSVTVVRIWRLDQLRVWNESKWHLSESNLDQEIE